MCVPLRPVPPMKTSSSGIRPSIVDVDQWVLALVATLIRVAKQRRTAHAVGLQALQRLLVESLEPGGLAGRDALAPALLVGLLGGHPVGEEATRALCHRRPEIAKQRS